MSHFVFVYGTLKKGFPNHDRFMRSARFIGNCRTREAYPLILEGERWVPCLVDRVGEGHRVAGELFEVDDATLGRIDWLEAVNEPGGYRRKIVEIEVEGPLNSEIMKAGAYFMPPENLLHPRSEPLKSYDMDTARRYKPRPGRPTPENPQ